MRACPLHAHWLEGEPMTGVLPMGGVLDRRRRLPADGTLTGVALLADAWACTNPSVGRGMTFGLMHGALLRDTLREHEGGSAAFAAAWDEATEREMAPWYEATVAADRARHGPAAGGARRRPLRRARRPGVAAARRAAARRWASTRTPSARAWRSSAAWPCRARCSRGRGSPSG